MEVEVYKGSALLVEDNVKLNNINARALESRGYEVYSAHSLAEARQRLLWVDPDVILLDVMLPDGTGFDFCKEIRGKTMAHILFLTGRADHEDMVQGIKIGGDGYITKPFHPEEMLVKVDAAIRRRNTDKAQVVKKGNLELDIMARQAFSDGKTLELTGIEFSLLLLLVKNEGNILNSNYIYETVWRAPAIENKRALQSAISKLRIKIEHTGYSISAQRSQGYIFEKS